MEDDEEEMEPLTQVEIRQAWLMCLSAATIGLSDPQDKNAIVRVAEDADELLAEYRMRFNPAYDEEEEEEEPARAPRKKKGGRK